MANTDHFVQGWKARFPGTDPPKHIVQYIRDCDIGDLTQELENSYIRIQQLQEEMNRQEFISSYIREILKKEKSVLVEHQTTPEDPLDRDVPLLSSTDTFSSDHSYTEISYDNVPSLKTPDSHKQIYANDPVISQHEGHTVAKAELKLPPKPIPTPRASTLQPVRERASVFIAVNDDNEYEKQDKKVSRGYSLDSKTQVPMRKAPRLPTKPSKESIKKFQRNEVIDFSNEKTHLENFDNGHRKVSKKGSDASLTKTSSEESCEIAISPKFDSAIKPDYDVQALAMSTFKPANKPKPSNFSPQPERKLVKAASSSFSRSPKVSKKLDESEHIYDDPIPAREDQIEDASSSDEEPVYYNLMLLKQKQAMNPRITFASLDLHKKKLENDAKNLSYRFSVQTDHLRNVKPVNTVTVPLMKKLPSKIIKGVTEEESSTEQEFSGGGNIENDSTDSLGSMGDRSESVDSLGSLSSTNDDESLRKRRNLQLAAEDSAYSEELSINIPTITDPDNNSTMRKWVVNSILDSEQGYVATLDVLQQYRNSFRAAEKTSLSVICEEDTNTIFFGISDLHKIHFQFIQDLKPRVERWTAETQVADLFKILATEEIPIAQEYLNNYQKAVQAVHRCSEDQRFRELAQSIKVGKKEAPTLEELLHKPVVRFQRNTLVLHDLINCTPTSHVDYDLLQKTLKLAANFLDNYQTPQVEREHGDSGRYLARYSAIVEKVGTHRKLRHIFLFNDMLICSKQKISGRSKVHHETKWAIPLLDLSLDDKVTDDEKIAASHRENIEKMQRNVAVYQGELKEEMKKLKANSEGGRSWSMRSHNKTIEKIRKKLLDQEAALVLQSPHLVFRLKNGKTHKSFTLLLSSDYERTNWKDTIAGLKGKVNGSVNISSIDLTQLINTVKLPKLTGGSLIDESLLLEDEHLFGMLNVTIHRLHGLKSSGDVYCCLELDSFGHFFMKAKTRINRGFNRGYTEPVWDEAFELDLEGAQTLRILCYQAVAGADKLLGKCALELSKAWLRGDFQEKTVPFNQEMSVSVSLGYASRDSCTMKRTKTVKGGVFGQHIAKVTRQEGSDIPNVVKACVQEVEARGFDEVGIYRVSGLSSDIETLKKAFDKSSRGAVQLAHDLDIHVLASLLKLYLRELPEALLTDEAYSSFSQGMNLSDPEAKEKFMIQLVKSLPKCNQVTLLYLLDHMLKVSQFSSENKMTLHNLATVFGPTLLRKPVKQEVPISIELFGENAKEAMMQTGVLLYLLQVRQSGWDQTDTRL